MLAVDKQQLLGATNMRGLPRLQFAIPMLRIDTRSSSYSFM